METVGTMLQKRPVSSGTFYLEDNSKHNITPVITSVIISPNIIRMEYVCNDTIKDKV